MKIKYCPICMQEMEIIKRGCLIVFKCPYCSEIFYISWEVIREGTGGEINEIKP